jgi:hypothetical protein
MDEERAEASAASGGRARPGHRVPTDRLYGAEDEPSTVGRTVRFVVLCKELIDCLQSATVAASENSLFEADAAFMTYKQKLVDLIPFRDFSDGVSLVVLTLLKAASVKHLAHQMLPSLEMSRKALMMLKDHPKMHFSDAVALSDEFEKVAGLMVLLPGYDQIARLLLSEYETTQQELDFA